ncbi:C-terminal processing protease CtpA/Prc, contains a PDZ domain [Clostridium cavendishii DSM 21758]|uniref:C-terminal processing protease CtpA/Prc, contains a PDZ domain n=1 Tax=Clostridium cavendishii DSM 21758 TaxID=1121302 RepID=A0A1M6IXJ0_9CLOT|nr:S41 family peptidase [Clostridium cavendishii]SHJ39160.1 C-terminal processing protease CtpA/Prc, contains a PDZ domain [Clostridium cavendishii DSM 21758]
MKKKILIITSILLLIICIGYIYMYNNTIIQIYTPKPYVSLGDASLEKLLKANEIKEDTTQMIKIMETTHPIFLETIPEKYKNAKEIFLKETNKDMTTKDFQYCISRYLSSIKDGHTRIYCRDKYYLDVKLKYLNQKLVLLDEKNLPTDKVVTKINGVSIDKVISTIDDLFPAENYVAKGVNISNYVKSQDLLTLAGIDCSKDMSLSVKDKEGEKDIQVNFQIPSYTVNNKHEISSKTIDDKTIYIKLETCELNNSFGKTLDDLNKAVKNNIKNVIIDVRNNGGGTSNACLKLLEAIKMKPGNFGAVLRFSPLASERYGFLQKSGYYKDNQSNNVTKNENIKLYVLMNENTFSSAQWMATWVKDGKLGTLVGQPCSNMPSSFGDALDFQLKNSKLEGQISHKKFLRPDKSKNDERVLEPDIKVDYSEDALNKALDTIKSNTLN